MQDFAEKTSVFGGRSNMKKYQSESPQAIKKKKKKKNLIDLTQMI